MMTYPVQMGVEVYLHAFFTSPLE